MRKFPLSLLLAALAWAAVPPLHAVEAAAPVELGAGAAAAPLPVFQLSPAQIGDAYGQAKLGFDQAIQSIVSIPDDQRSFANTVQALETANAEFSEKTQNLVFLGYTGTDPDVRAAAQAVEQQAGKDSVELWARPELYAAVKAYADKKETLTGEDSRLFDALMRTFKEGGHGLEPEKKARLQKVQERLSELSTQFEANIAADNGALEMTREQLDGLPEDFVGGLQRTPEGKYRVTLKYPDYIPFMRYAKDAGARQQLQLLYANRAAEKNLPLLSEALRLRDEQAKLLGYKDYPSQAIDGRTAETPARVWSFLNRLWPMLRRRGEKDLAALLEMKRRDDPSAAAIQSHELNYYGEKLRRERYDLDGEQVKQYFPVDTVVAGTMRVYQRVLGVKFTEQPADGAWSPDVRLFRVDDAQTGKQLGYFYLDLYPREGKYSHAAAFTIVSGRELPGGAYRMPVSAMVANFPKATPGKPALMPHGDVETFFHEFGHLMHQTLTQARYASLSGSSVARDFVEAPSQMLENFVWQKEVLDEVSGRWDDPAQKIPDELFQKMLAARGFNKGLHYLGQLAYAMIDMTFHTAVPLETTRLYNQIMEVVGLIPPQAAGHPEAAFGHIMGGYGAGYYGYLWSEVFADDAFTRFAREGLFNPAVGLAWRREVLEKGASRPEMESLKAFLGREPSEKAFTDKLSGPEDAGGVNGAFSGDAVEAARRAGISRPLTGLDDPRVADPKALLAEGWSEQGAPEADVVHYTRTAGGAEQRLTLDIFGGKGFAVLTTTWEQDGIQRQEKLTSVDGKIGRSESRRQAP